MCQNGWCSGKMEVLLIFRNSYSLEWLRGMCTEKMLEDKVEKPTEKAGSPKKLYPLVRRKAVGAHKEGCATADLCVPQFSHQCNWQRYPSELFVIFSIVSEDCPCWTCTYLSVRCLMGKIGLLLPRAEGWEPYSDLSFPIAKPYQQLMQQLSWNESYNQNQI